eukprot:TRINITY_DN9955_c0_g1_i7.p1 TRINITY_DN9955_c0_g1~~TRINITY_DN9955_c0_g1_i7.p1  ORF type:complete len:624 (+),score=70.75 TRINITY_DN9955_c0_g1_i7:82-1872(+)
MVVDEALNNGDVAEIWPCTHLGDLEVLRCSLRKAAMQFIKEQDSLISTYGMQFCGEHVSDRVDGGFANSALAHSSSMEVKKQTGQVSVPAVLDVQPSKWVEQPRHANLIRGGNSVVTTPSFKLNGIDRFHSVCTKKQRLEMVFLTIGVSSHFFVRCSHIVLQWMEWWESLREPRREGFLARVILSPSFNLLSCIVIMINGIVLIASLNKDISKHTHASEAEPDEHEHIDLIASEAVFTVFYLVELIMKLVVHRLHFFCNRNYIRNVTDLVFALAGIPDLLYHGSAVRRLPSVRVFRLFRVCKAARVFRAIIHFQDLRLVASSICACFIPFLGCIVLLLLVFFVFSVLFVQSFALYLERASGDVGDLTRLVGSVEKTMLSLFAATTGGEDWVHLYTEIARLGAAEGFAFLCFVAFCQIAVWNVVTSVFVEKAIKLAEPDISVLLLEKHRNDIKDFEELKSLILKCGALHADDTITLESLIALTENRHFTDFFQLRGLDIKDAETFHAMLGSVSDTHSVNLDTFVRGCLRMKGSATGIDLHTLSFQTKLALSTHSDEMSVMSSRAHELQHTLRLMQTSLAELAASFNHSFGDAEKASI